MKIIVIQCVARIGMNKRDNEQCRIFVVVASILPHCARRYLHHKGLRFKACVEIAIFAHPRYTFFLLKAQDSTEKILLICFRLHHFA